MALAAQQRKRTAYGRASGNASQAELDLVGAIRSLKALGYRTGG
jgi:hypothetical protein